MESSDIRRYRVELSGMKRGRESHISEEEVEEGDTSEEIEKGE